MVKKSLFYVLLFFAFTSIFSQEQNEWKGLEEKNLKISKIEIKVNDVFDLSKKDESHLLGRVANALHIETKKSIVKGFLLFKEGDSVDSRIIYKSERILRELDWVRDAYIYPIVYENGDVTATVYVHDAWSLKGGLKFSSVGGENTFRIRLHEVNLLGFGKTLMVGYEKNPERTIGEIEYFDPLLLGTRWQLFSSYQKLSDGYYKKLKIEYPFYELTAPYSFRIDASREKLNLKFYQNGDLSLEIPSIKDEASVYFQKALVARKDKALRGGIEFWSRQNLYDSPYHFREDLNFIGRQEDRRYRGFVLYLGYFEDKFKTFENIKATQKAEDYNLGYEATTHLGFFAKDFGSTSDAKYFDLKINKGFAVSDDVLIFGEVRGEGRREDSLNKNVQMNLKFDYYNLKLKKQTFAASLEVFLGSRLDIENYVYIGGSDGLRGYPNHFRIGERRWIASAEDRIITDKTLWGIVQMGYVAYFDAGAIKPLQSEGWTKTYANVGFGLRLGNLKSAFGHIILVSVAVPLVKEKGMDSYQFVFGNFIRF